MQPPNALLKRIFSNFFLYLLDPAKSVIFALLKVFCAHKKELADVGCPLRCLFQRPRH
jgi:hypothetical protein